MLSESNSARTYQYPRICGLSFNTVVKIAIAVNILLIISGLFNPLVILHAQRHGLDGSIVITGLRGFIFLQVLINISGYSAIFLGLFLFVLLLSARFPLPTKIIALFHVVIGLSWLFILNPWLNFHSFQILHLFYPFQYILLPLSPILPLISLAVIFYYNGLRFGYRKYMISVDQHCIAFATKEKTMAIKYDDVRWILERSGWRKVTEVNSSKGIFKFDRFIRGYQDLKVDLKAILKDKFNPPEKVALILARRAAWRYLIRNSVILLIFDLLFVRELMLAYPVPTMLFHLLIIAYTLWHHSLISSGVKIARKSLHRIIMTAVVVMLFLVSEIQFKSGAYYLFWRSNRIGWVSNFAIKDIDDDRAQEIMYKCGKQAFRIDWVNNGYCIVEDTLIHQVPVFHNKRLLVLSNDGSGLNGFLTISETNAYLSCCFGGRGSVIKIFKFDGIIPVKYWQQEVSRHDLVTAGDTDGDGLNEVILLSSNMLSIYKYGVKKICADRVPPELTIREFPDEDLHINRQYYGIEGECSDNIAKEEDMVIDIFVNGRSCRLLQPGDLRVFETVKYYEFQLINRDGIVFKTYNSRPEEKWQLPHFRALVSLKLGRNEIRVVAKDPSGNAAEKTAVIFYEKTIRLRREVIKPDIIPFGIEVVDLDNNGLPEIITGQYGPNACITILEWSGLDFKIKWQSVTMEALTGLLVRKASDYDSDGEDEILIETDSRNYHPLLLKSADGDYLLTKADDIDTGARLLGDICGDGGKYRVWHGVVEKKQKAGWRAASIQFPLYQDTLSEYATFDVDDDGVVEIIEIRPYVKIGNKLASEVEKISDEQLNRMWLSQPWQFTIGNVIAVWEWNGRAFRSKGKTTTSDKYVMESTKWFNYDPGFPISEQDFHWGDFDGDKKTEALITSYDYGKGVILEWEDSMFVCKWQGKTNGLVDAIVADLDKDGFDELTRWNTVYEFNGDKIINVPICGNFELSKVSDLDADGWLELIGVIDSAPDMLAVCRYDGKRCRLVWTASSLNKKQD